MNIRVILTAALAVLALGAGLIFSSHRAEPTHRHTRALYPTVERPKYPRRPVGKSKFEPSRRPGPPAKTETE